MRPIRQEEYALSSRISAQGWSTESVELAAFIEEPGLVNSSAKGVKRFLAEIEGEPIHGHDRNFTRQCVAAKC